MLAADRGGIALALRALAGASRIAAVRRLACVGRRGLALLPAHAGLSRLHFLEIAAVSQQCPASCVFLQSRPAASAARISCDAHNAEQPTSSRTLQSFRMQCAKQSICHAICTPFDSMQQASAVMISPLTSILLQPAS